MKTESELKSKRVEMLELIPEAPNDFKVNYVLGYIHGLDYALQPSEKRKR